VANHIEFATHARTSEVRERIAKSWDNIEKMKRSLAQKIRMTQEMENALNERLEERGEYDG
jgi:hypothetical protein